MKMHGTSFKFKNLLSGTGSSKDTSEKKRLRLNNACHHYLTLVKSFQVKGIQQSEALRSILRPLASK